MTMEMSNKRIDSFLEVSSVSEPLNDLQMTDLMTKIGKYKVSALLLIQAELSAPFEQRGIITILSGNSSLGTAAERANPVHDEEMRLNPHVADGLQGPVVGDTDEGEVLEHLVRDQLRELVNVGKLDSPPSPLNQKLVKRSKALSSGGAVTAGLTRLLKTVTKTPIGQGGWGRAVPSPMRPRSRNWISIMKLLPGRLRLVREHGTVLISDDDKQATGRKMVLTGELSGSPRLATTYQFASGFLQANLAGNDRGSKAEINVVIPDIVRFILPSAGACLY